MAHAAFVIGKNGERLMPTSRLGRVRHLLKEKKAIIVNHQPFTIQLLYDSTTYVQEMELCVDSGYEHVGISLKSAAKEHVSEQYDLLPDEKAKHDDCRRFRRTRRNRLRYRKCRIDNRKTRISKAESLPPSLQHKKEAQERVVEKYIAAAPVSDVFVEVAQFDTAVLKAVEEGRPIPEGEEYQHGDRYGTATLREAVFQRDHHKCCFCGRSVGDNAVLHAHHALYWKGRHGNSVSEMATCCERCHTAANHQEGGKLWGYTPKSASLEEAAFMNTVRYQMTHDLKERYGGIVHRTYGALTKCKRADLGIEKSHANDAYAMGNIHPIQRAETVYWKKRRRNNRVLEKFYDAQYVDRRNGTKKSGKELGCERTNRREPRAGEKSLRPFRGEKSSKGRRSIRKSRYRIQPGNLVLWQNEKHTARGCHCNGSRVMLDNGKSVAVNNVKLLRYASGWEQYTPQNNTSSISRKEASSHV